MKLCELNLRAFGSFNNTWLRFDPSKPLQVLYGPNEAGKTTFSRAFVSLIYGLSKKTKDDYLFPREHLYIEGLFQSDEGKFLRVIREKKNSKKTSDLLRPFFPSIGREGFVNNYILNQETLQKGSENLLKFLGQFNLEFLESKGMSTLKNVMNEIEELKKKLFKDRGRIPVINSGFTKYLELEDQRKQLDLKVEDFDDLQARKKELIEKRKQIDHEINDLKKYSQKSVLTDQYTEALVSFLTIEKKYQDIKRDIDQQPHEQNLLKILPNPEQFWIRSKSLLNSYEQLQFEYNSEKNRLEKEKKSFIDIQKQIDDYDLKEGLDKLEEDFSNIAKSMHLLKSYEALSSDLKHQERMIARLSRELAITADIRDILSEKESYTTPDLKPLEKKYQELKAKWQAFEINKRSVAEEVNHYEKLVKSFKIEVFNFETFKNKRLKRVQLENELLSTLDSVSLREQIDFYIKYVQEESSLVDLLLNNTESFSEYQKNRSLLLKAQKALTKLEKEEKKLLQEREKLEDWMSRFSFSKNFSFHEFGLFRLFMERVEKLMTRIYQYHRDLKNESHLLTKVSVLKEKLFCALEVASLPQSGDLAESFTLLNEWIQRQKKQVLKYEKNLSKTDYLRDQITQKEKKLEDIIKNQNQLFKQLKESYPDHKIDNSQILNLKNELESFLTQTLKLKEILQQKNILINQLKQLQDEIRPFLDFSTKSFFLREFTDWNSAEIQGQVEENKIFKEKNKLQLESQFEAQSSLDKEIGQIEYKLSVAIHKNQKISLEKNLKDTLFEIEEGIQQYLIQDISLEVLSTIASEYQNQYKTEVLHLATEYFKLLTLGQYEKISINMIKEGSFLMLEGTNGSVGVDSLSLGSRVQLYLALKLAFIEAQTDNKETFPILLDDLFVQFDDQRAKEGLKLLEKLAQKRQIFFLTHHSHLLGLIEKDLDPSLYSLLALNGESLIK